MALLDHEPKHGQVRRSDVDGDTQSICSREGGKCERTEDSSHMSEGERERGGKEEREWSVLFSRVLIILFYSLQLPMPTRGKDVIILVEKLKQSNMRARAQTCAAVCDGLWKGSARQSACFFVECASPSDGSPRLNHGQTSESTEIDVKQTGGEQEVNSNLRNARRC